MTLYEKGLNAVKVYSKMSPSNGTVEGGQINGRGTQKWKEGPGIMV